MYIEMSSNLINPQSIRGDICRFSLCKKIISVGNICVPCQGLVKHVAVGLLLESVQSVRLTPPCLDFLREARGVSNKEIYKND